MLMLLSITSQTKALTLEGGLAFQKGAVKADLLGDGLRTRN